MDPLSDVFSLLIVRAARCTKFEASGNWSYRFPARSALKFGAVIRGDCWILLHDNGRHRLAAGDTFLLANTPGFVLTNDEMQLPQDGMAVFDWENSDVARHDGDDTAIIAGTFAFEASNAELLLDALPRFLLVPGHNAAAPVIRSTLQVLDSEVRSKEIGGTILTKRLADILLVQVLRAALAQNNNENFGWVSALTDARIGKAIGLMHGDITHRWTLDELASAVAMSRSTFSRQFKALVNLTPLDYLLRWRMRLACDSLRRGTTVAEAASHTGYASESAFGHAFKRVHGVAPKSYLRRAGNPRLTDRTMR